VRGEGGIQRALTLEDLNRYVRSRDVREPGFARAVANAQQQEIMRRLLAGETVGPEAVPAPRRWSA
jgi:hypothetical protein